MAAVPMVVAAIIATLTGPAEPTQNQWDSCTGGAVEARLSACAAIVGNPEFNRVSRAYAAANLGDVHLEQEQLIEARAEFSRAIRLDPVYGYPYRRRAFVQFVEHRVAEAEADFARAIELSPMDPYAFVARASFYRQTTQMDLARDDIEQALKLDLSNPDLYFERGLWSLEVRDYEQAELDFRKAIRLNPEDHIARYNLANALRHQARNEDALREIDAYVESVREDPQGYRMRGWLQTDMGRYDAADADFQTALTRLPDDLTLNYAIGYVHWMRGEFESALEQFAMAEPNFAESGYYFYERGYARYMLNQDKLALDDANRSLEIDGGNVDAMWLKGAALLYLDDYPAALKVLNAAAGLDPENVEILIMRGRVNIAAEYFLAAVGDLSRALELQPDQVSAAAYRGYASGLAGHMEIGRAALDSAIAKRPRAPLAYELSARLLYRDHDYKAARNYSDRLVQLQPEDPQYQVLHADIIVELGQYQEAAELYRQAVDTVPEPSAAWLRMAAYSASRAGDRDNAFEFLKRARLADPGDSWTSGMLADFWLERSEFDKAELAFDHAISGAEEGHDIADLRLGKAKALAGSGSPDAALDALTVLAKEYPANADVSWTRANLLSDLGRKPEAISEFQFYRGLKPASLEVHYKLVAMLRDAGDNRAAEDLATAIIDLETDKAAAYQLRGRIHFDLAEFGAAGIDFGKALDLEPGNSALQALQARTLLAAGRLSPALVHARRAVELAPQSADAHLILARILIDGGDARSALGILDRALVLDSNLAEIHYLAASAHKMLGQTDRALAALQLAGTLDDGQLSPQIAGLQEDLR